MPMKFSSVNIITSGVRFGVRVRLVLGLVGQQRLRVRVRMVVVLVEVGLRGRGGRGVLRRVVLVQRRRGRRRGGRGRSRGLRVPAV